MKSPTTSWSLNPLRAPDPARLGTRPFMAQAVHQLNAGSRCRHTVSAQRWKYSLLNTPDGYLADIDFSAAMNLR
jgi:hypothetical protein